MKPGQPPGLCARNGANSCGGRDAVRRQMSGCNDLPAVGIRRCNRPAERALRRNGPQAVNRRAFSARIASCRL
jgi:hypothetical protein